MRIATIILELVSGLQGLLGLGRERLKGFLAGLFWLMACALIVSGLVLAAAGFILFGFYQFLLAHMSPPLAALMVSITALLLAGGASVILKRRLGLRMRF